MRKLLPFVFLFFAHSALVAQETTILDNNPTTLKWYQINSQHFRILFPKGFEDQAQRMANTFERIRVPEANSLGSYPRKISVILQNQSSISNGFVSILPRRSEFYTMPSQNYNFLGTNDWLNLLASHEYRHIVQYQHATRGFNKAFYYVFGSITLAGMAQVAAPQWFWEGDAVATETAFTHSGRGRIPNFGLVFRTNLLEGREFNYHKQYLRSYKNNIPDHYVLGYHMVSYLRKRTNDVEIWGKITARSWNVPFFPFAFSNAIKKETGLHVTDLYREMAKDLKKEWKAQIDSLSITPFERITNRNSNTYTDFLYPQPLQDGSVIALRIGIGNIEQFVRVNTGRVEKVYTPGFVNDAGMLSVNVNKIVWTEYGYDPRWSVRNYSKVKLFDFTRRKKTILGDKKGRYGSAAISPDGTRVVAIRTGKDYKTQVVILDTGNGKTVKEFLNPENVFYSMPRWSEDGKHIAILKTKKEGRTICILDVDSGTEEEIIPYSHENIGHPVLHEHYVLFNSPVGGIDNIHAIDLASRQRYQVTVSRYGAYNPAISTDGKMLFYNDQSRDGLDIVKTAFNPSTWKPFHPIDITDNLSENLEEQEGRPNLLDTVAQTQFPVTRYRKFSGILNPYGWGLNITNDLNLNQINAGIVSRDILSTVSINADYVYDLNERTSLWRAGVSYQGLYPILDLQAQTGNRTTTKSAFGGDEVEFDWKETNVEGGMRIPLVFTNSKYIQQLNLGGAIGLTRTSAFQSALIRDGFIIDEGDARIAPANDSLLFIYKDVLTNGDLLYNRLTFSYYHLLKRSPRDFLYRWGQSLEFDLYQTLTGSDFNGQLYAVRSTAYFPGLFKHHYLYGRAAYQESQQSVDVNTYTFRNRIAKPRGYSFPTDEKFLTLSANYALPLWYPDIALGPVLNVKRIKANFFFDYGKGTGRQYYYSKNQIYFSSTDAIYQSFGVETTFDFNVMRFLPQFELGFRTTYRLENRYNPSGVMVEFIIGNIRF